MNTDSIETFGDRLLKTQDLDPVYTALYGLTSGKHPEMGQEQLRRWLVAYWCYYNAGVASWLSEHEGADFWGYCDEAAWNGTTPPVGDRWPRGAERRHFRGDLAISSVAELRKRYPSGPEDMVDYVAGSRTFLGVSERVQEHRGFGPWIGFKVADMVERVLGLPVEFTNASVFMFKDPTKAALMLWEERWKGCSDAAGWSNEQKIHLVADYLVGHWMTWDAPPLFDRKVNIQEVETILCKWKSYRNGHYPYGKDTQELRHTATQWSTVCPTAKAFLKHLPLGTP